VKRRRRFNRSFGQTRKEKKERKERAKFGDEEEEQKCCDRKFLADC
jgi:hypothetical protein